MKNKNFFKISLIYFIAIISIAIIFILGSLGLIRNEFLSSFLIQILVMFTIPLLLYTLLIGKNFKTTFKNCGFNKFSCKMLLISIALGFVLYFINSFIATFFSGIISSFGYESLSSSRTVTLNYQFLLKEFILTAILPGICEEFLHRGIMLNAAKKHASPRYCLLISSLLFGLMHLNINQFFYATILGFLIGIVALASNSIYPSIIIHFLNNFLSSYFVYGAKLNWPIAKLVESIENAFSSNIFIFVASSSLCIILLFGLYLYLIKRLVFERTRIEMTKVLKDLNVLEIPVEQAQESISQINTVLKKSESVKGIISSKGEKPDFKNNIFIISSIILGALVTICSFIWGIL